MNGFGMASGAGRRDFLKGAAWMGVVAAAAGASPFKVFGASVSGAPMQGVGLGRKLEKVRVAVIGVGRRGVGIHRNRRRLDLYVRAGHGASARRAPRQRPDGHAHARSRGAGGPRRRR